MKCGSRTVIRGVEDTPELTSLCPELFVSVIKHLCFLGKGFISLYLFLAIFRCVCLNLNNKFLQYVNNYKK